MITCFHLAVSRVGTPICHRHRGGGLEQSSEGVVPEWGSLEQGMLHEMLDRLEKMLGRHTIRDSRCVSNIGDITAFVENIC